MIGSPAVNEKGELGLVTGREMVDLPLRAFHAANAKPGEVQHCPDGTDETIWTERQRRYGYKVLLAGQVRVAWTGIKLPGGGGWRGENVRAATKDEIAGLG